MTGILIHVSLTHVSLCSQLYPLKNVRLVEEIGFKEIKILEEIGVGSFGSVYKAMCDDLLCAAKKIHTALVGPSNSIPNRKNLRISIRVFEAQFKFLQELRHPNIVQYLGMYCEPSSPHQPVLLMELMEKSLTHYLERATGSIPYRTQVSICFDIARALSYLHVNEVLHGKLSCNNVLLSGETCRAKLSDLGMADSLNFIVGTSVYDSMPPESFDAQYKYSASGDMFSFGVIIVQIITREFPTPSNKFQHIQEGNRQIRVCISEIDRRKNHLSRIEQDHPLLPITLSCLQDNDRDRPTASGFCRELASVADGIQYTNSEQAGHHPHKSATADKNVDTSDIPSCNESDEDSRVKASITAKLHFPILTFDTSKKKAAQEQQTLAFEQVIEDKDIQIEALQCQVEAKQKVLENLVIQNDTSLQNLRAVIENLSKNKENLLQAQNTLIEQLEAQLNESDEANLKLKQQLEEKNMLIEKQKQTISEYCQRLGDQASPTEYDPLTTTQQQLATEGLINDSKEIFQEQT